MAEPRKIGRGSSYTVLLRSHGCGSDKIRKIDPDKLMLNSGTTFLRSEVLFVGEGLSSHEILYRGRSSWSDVQGIHVAPLGNLKIWLKSGASLSGSEVSASGLDVTIKRYGRLVKIPKDEVAQVYYVRFKPVSEAHRHFAREDPFLQLLDPKLWQYCCE